MRPCDLDMVEVGNASVKASLAFALEEESDFFSISSTRENKNKHGSITIVFLQ